MHDAVRARVAQLALAAVLIIEHLPVDIRHNSKVDRNRVADEHGGLAGRGSASRYESSRHRRNEFARCCAVCGTDGRGDNVVALRDEVGDGRWLQVQGDIRDATNLPDVMRGADAVIHLAPSR